MTSFVRDREMYDKFMTRVGALAVSPRSSKECSKECGNDLLTLSDSCADGDAGDVAGGGFKARGSGVWCRF